MMVGRAHFIVAALAVVPLFGQQETYESREVLRVASLHGPAQVRELRKLLLHPPDEPGLLDTFFYFERRLRPAMRKLRTDPSVGGPVSEHLAFLGLSEDVSFLFRTIRRSPDLDDELAYSLVCAMLSPTSEAQWAFLRNAALGKLQGQWVQTGAVETLMLNASLRSRMILEEVQQKNPERRVMASNALRYVSSKPGPLFDQSLTSLAERAARAMELLIGRWQGNSSPRYNEARDKALVDCAFESGLDRLFYTATFHQVRNNWILKGIRETRQEAPAPPPPPKP